MFPTFSQPPFDPFVVNRNIHQHHPSHRSTASHRAPRRALELPSSTRDLAQRYLPACACNWFICCPEVVFVTGALDHSTGFSLPPQAGEVSDPGSWEGALFYSRGSFLLAELLHLVAGDVAGLPRLLVCFLESINSLYLQPLPELTTRESRLLFRQKPGWEGFLSHRGYTFIVTASNPLLIANSFAVAAHGLLVAGVDGLCRCER